ncbi:MAG: hypothetical protein R3D03_11090 [Geminicoccaceae bacterium]
MPAMSSRRDRMREVFDHPRHPHTRGLLDSVPRPDRASGCGPLRRRAEPVRPARRLPLRPRRPLPGTSAAGMRRNWSRPLPDTVRAVTSGRSAT